MREIDKVLDRVNKSHKSGYTKEEVVHLLRGGLKKKEPLPKLELDGVSLDPNSLTVTVDGVTTRPPLKIFMLTEYLMRHKGWIVSRETLLSELWGEDVRVLVRTVDVHIKQVRDLVGRGRIQTVKGLGYGWQD